MFVVAANENVCEQGQRCVKRSSRSPFCSCLPSLVRWLKGDGLKRSTRPGQLADADRMLYDGGRAEVEEGTERPFQETRPIQ